MTATRATSAVPRLTGQTCSDWFRQTRACVSSKLCGLQVRQERDALEAMRMDFEHELQQAQAEVTRAQDALKTAEDRVRAVEQVERQKIISGTAPSLRWEQQAYHI